MVEQSAMMTQVNLFVSARKLADLDTFSKSDPQCRLYEKRQNQWHEIGRTETIMNNLNPDFKTSFTVAYYFEKVQHFKFSLIDVDNGESFDTIGEAEVTMGSLMGASRQTYTTNLSHNGKTNRGSLIVRTQAIEQSNFVAKWNLRWQNVPNMTGGCAGMCQDRAQYRCQIMREVPGTENFTIGATVPGSFNTPDVRMVQQTLTLAELCNSNKNARMKFVLVIRSAGVDQEIAGGITTIADLEAGKTTIQSGGNCTLVVDNFEVKERPTFIDYLRAGWQVSLTVAVDYTASNGEPSSPSSLHYLGPNNQYEQALFNVGMVVEPYDNDKMFPVFGFGGIPRHMGITGVNHCFAMNGNPANPDINGIQAIVATYRQTLPQIGLGGPTLFGPLLQEFLTLVRSSAGQTSYQILLLLTDGTIHDMPRTKDLIYELAELPCSIIIIGVGHADFSAMEELDGDDGPLRNERGQAVARDIVQFVEFNKSVARGDLAEQVLKEVPGQVCSYMERSGFNPVALQQEMPPMVPVVAAEGQEFMPPGGEPLAPAQQ